MFVVFGLINRAGANFTATIPSTEGNPYITTTSLPEGTVFIAVGSILLGLFVAVAVIRLVSYYVVRKRAVASQARFTALRENAYGGPFVDPVYSSSGALGLQGMSTNPNTGTSLGGSGAGVGAGIGSGAAAGSGAAGTGQRQNPEGLFFSPIEEVMRTGNLEPQGNMLSSYVSSTYQASNAAVSSRTGRPISTMMELGGRAADSPVHGPSEPYANSSPSTSHLEARNQTPSSHAPSNRGRKQRPPTMYLDDLLNR